MNTTPARHDQSAGLARNSPRWAASSPFEPHHHRRGPFLMHYLDEGPRDAEPVLMVHGNPTWSFYYRKLVLALRGERRCVVPDHIGCGLSDKPQTGYPYTLESRIDDLESLVLDLDLRDITLVVHDWGGAIGLGFAGRHPDRIKRIVLFNTGAFRSDLMPPSIDLCRVPIIGPAIVRGLNGFALVAQLRAAARPFPADVRRGYLAPYGSWRDRIAIQRFVEDIPMTPAHPSYETLYQVEEGLPTLAHLPKMLVWGERDFCFSPEFRRAFEHIWPDIESHPVQDASHFVLEDASDLCIRLVKDFLSRHP